MKRLFIIRLLIVTSVFVVCCLMAMLWFFTQKETHNHFVQKAVINNFLLSPRFEGKDMNGRSYLLKAYQATQTSKNLIALSKPFIQFETINSGPVTITSLNGLFDRHKKALELKNDVMAVVFNGYTFATKAAQIDLDKNEVVGNDPITGQGPLGKIRANKFHILEKGDRIIFKDTCEMTFYYA